MKVIAMLSWEIDGVSVYAYNKSTCNWGCFINPDYEVIGLKNLVFMRV